MTLTDNRTQAESRNCAFPRVQKGCRYGNKTDAWRLETELDECTKSLPVVDQASNLWIIQNRASEFNNAGLWVSPRDLLMWLGCTIYLIKSIFKPVNVKVNGMIHHILLFYYFISQLLHIYSTVQKFVTFLKILILLVSKDALN